MSRRPTLVAVGVLKHQGKIALIQFKRNMLAGYWGLPGGKIDDGESLPEAVERELFEEVGARVKYKNLVAVLDEEIITKKGTEHFLMMVCEVKSLDKLEFKRLEHEEGIVDWFTEHEVKSGKIPIVPSDYNVITRIAFGKEQGYFYSKLDMICKPPKLTKFESSS